MSSSPVESVPVPPNRPGGRVVLAVLILTPLMSLALSALLVLSILHFLAQVPSSAVARGLVGDPRLLRDIVEPFAQKGTVPVKQFSGVVYYPVPYATPPHLNLTSKSEDRSYAIVRQDEFGFVWAVDVGLKNIKDLAGALKDDRDLQDVAGAFKKVEGKAVPKLRPDSAFTWEARGVRPFTTQAASPPYRQQGTFTCPPGGPHEQIEYFRSPYAVPPNVTFSYPPSPSWDVPQVKILMTTSTGFHWQAVNPTNPQRAVKITWTAKGVRARPEQIAEFGKNSPTFAPVIEAHGKLTYASGEQGTVGFGRPFASPPHVEVENVIVTDVTAREFKWKHPLAKNPNSSASTTTWTARGVPDPRVGRKAAEK